MSAMPAIHKEVADRLESEKKSIVKHYLTERPVTVIAQAPEVEEAIESPQDSSAIVEETTAQTKISRLKNINQKFKKKKVNKKRDIVTLW